MISKLPPRILLSFILVSGAPALAARQSPQTDSSARSGQNPNQPQVDRARVFMAEKRYEDAVQAYLELAKAEPKNALYWNMAGIAYLNLSDFDQARKYFQRAVKADKKYSSAVNNIGMVYYHQKNFRRAIREYQRAVAIDPRQAGTHANLGFAYYNTNKYELAAQEFQTAIGLDPMVFERTAKVGTMVEDRSVSNHGQFFYTMARVYAQKSDAARCAAYLRKSLDEGFKDIANVKTDPVFKPLLNDPEMQAVLALIAPTDQKEAVTQPGA